MNHFFELIQISIGTRPASFSSSLTDNEWEELFAMAKKHTLVGVMFSGIEKLPNEQRPCKRILLEWYLITTNIENRNRELNRTAAKVVRRFADDGMRACVLKGQGVATLYPHPLRRQSGDIDLWVEGGRKHVISYLHKYCKNMEIVYHHADFNVLKDTELEVHFTPSWMYNFSKNRELQYWFYKESIDQLSNIITLPSDNPDPRKSLMTVAPQPAFNRVYLLLHIFRHLLDEGIGLRQLMDYYFLLTTTTISERKHLESLEILDSLGLTRFASAVMYVMQTVFGMAKEYMFVEPEPEEGKFLIDEIMLAGNFGKYDLRSLPQEDEDIFQKFIRKQTRRMRFLRYHPEETLSAPLFILWQRCWRIWHKYL